MNVEVKEYFLAATFSVCISAISLVKELSHQFVYLFFNCRILRGNLQIWFMLKLHLNHGPDEYDTKYKFLINARLLFTIVIQ